MTLPSFSRNRKQIRQSIGYNLGALHVGVASQDGSQSELQDSTLRGGTDEYKGREVVMVDGTSGNIGAGSVVALYTPLSHTLTLSPELPYGTAENDEYEMWRLYSISEINDAINQAIIAAAGGCLVDCEDHTVFTDGMVYQYPLPGDMIALYNVEYVREVATAVTVHNCDAAWNGEPAAGVEKYRDTANKKEGSACLKLVVSDTVSADTVLLTTDIPAIDISAGDEIEFWLYATVALASGDLQLLLDSTAGCGANPCTETLDIPATPAVTWTRHVISLANPIADSGIISVGIVQHKAGAELGDYSLYLDDIEAVVSRSRVFSKLAPEHWSIIPGTSAHLRLTESGLMITGSATMLRLRGYRAASLLDSDADAAEIDPAYIISAVTGTILMSHAKSPEIDTQYRAQLATYWLTNAERRLADMATPVKPNTRWF